MFVRGPFMIRDDTAIIRRISMNLNSNYEVNNQQKQN